MTLTLNTTTCAAITIESTLLDDFIANPASYTNIVITAKYNDNAEITRIYTSINPIDATTDISTSGGVETVNPSLFDMTTFGQGVYSFDILLTAPSAVESEEGCIFVDCITTGECTGTLKKQIYELDQSDREFTFKAIQYQMLEQIGDCQCKCDKAYVIYENLVNSLKDCKTC